jgi:hypothetical protein
MEMSLGTFGDLRLDKGGARSSNRWPCARRCACGVWAAAVAVNFGLVGSLPVQKACPRESGGDGPEADRGLVRPNR